MLLVKTCGKTFLSGCLLWLCAACSLNTSDPSTVLTAQALLQSPEPAPNFVTQIDPAPGSTVETINHICLSIHYAYLWEAGDTETTITADFLSRVKLLVDGQDTAVNRDTFSYHGPAVVITDEDGTELGSVGIADMCFDVSLSSGVHLVTLQVSTSSGEINSYSWSFALERK